MWVLLSQQPWKREAELCMYLLERAFKWETGNSSILGKISLLCDYFANWHSRKANITLAGAGSSSSCLVWSHNSVTTSTPFITGSNFQLFSILFCRFSKLINDPKDISLNVTSLMSSPFISTSSGGSNFRIDSCVIDIDTGYEFSFSIRIINCDLEWPILSETPLSSTPHKALLLPIHSSDSLEIALLIGLVISACVSFKNAFIRIYFEMIRGVNNGANYYFYNNHFESSCNDYAVSAMLLIWDDFDYCSCVQHYQCCLWAKFICCYWKSGSKWKRIQYFRVIYIFTIYFIEYSFRASKTLARQLYVRNCQSVTYPATVQVFIYFFTDYLLIRIRMRRSLKTDLVALTLEL